MAKRLLSYTLNGTAIVDLPSYNPNDLGANAPYIWQNDDETIPADYVDICSVNTVNLTGSTAIVKANAAGINATTDWKKNRDNIKSIVDSVGFDTLNAENAKAAAKLNIGTGSQILAAIPNDAERDASSYSILCNMKGYPSGVRKERSLYLEAAFWSRLKHLKVNVGVEMEVPAFIYALITIKANQPTEIDGNLLVKYEEAGLQGFAGGDKILGIYDFIKETAGTRYAPYDPVSNPNGGGLVTHPLLANLVPSGFADMSAFQTYVENLFIDGNY